MTRSEVYAILNRVPDIDMELEIVNIRIEKMETTLKGHAIRTDVDKVQVSPSDKMAEVMADMEPLLLKQKKLQRALLAAEQETADLIGRLKDGKHRLVLTYRYTAGLSWENIGKRIGYDERHARRLRDEAVNLLCKSKDVRKCP